MLRSHSKHFPTCHDWQAPSPPYTTYLSVLESTANAPLHRPSHRLLTICQTPLKRNLQAELDAGLTLTIICIHVLGQLLRKYWIHWISMIEYYIFRSWCQQSIYQKQLVIRNMLGGSIPYDICLYWPKNTGSSAVILTLASPPNEVLTWNNHAAIEVEKVWTFHKLVPVQQFTN